MKKKKYFKIDQNVILFPNVYNRLTEKGMDALKQRNFTEALTFLKQANEIDYQLNIEIGIILCLFELGELDEAKQKCEKIFQEEGHYDFQLVHIYVTILIQQGNYRKIQSFLEEFLENEQVSKNQTENLVKILELSRKMTKTEFVHSNHEEDYEEINEHLNKSHDIQQQWQAIQSLRNYNLLKVLPLIKAFLQDETKHPMLKSILLELLKEHEIDTSIIINKFGFTQIFNPSKLQNIIDYPFTNEVLSIIEEFIGSKNPTLFEVIKEVWLRHLFVKYPFFPKHEHPKIWAAALHKLGCEMLGIEINETKLTQLYQISMSEIVECYKNLLEIEEISFIQF